MAGRLQSCIWLGSAGTEHRLRLLTIGLLNLAASLAHRHFVSAVIVPR